MTQSYRPHHSPHLGEDNKPEVGHKEGQACQFPCRSDLQWARESWCWSFTLCWRRKTSRKGTGEGNSLIRCRQLNLWSVRKGVREPGNNKGKLNALQVVGNSPSLLTSGIALGSWAAGRLLALPCPLPCQVFEGRLGDIIYTGDVTELKQMVTISSVEGLEGGMDWDAGNRHHLSWTVKAEKFWKCLFSVAWGWENPAWTEKHQLP